MPSHNSGTRSPCRPVITAATSCPSLCCSRMSAVIHGAPARVVQTWTIFNPLGVEGPGMPLQDDSRCAPRAALAVEAVAAKPRQERRFQILLRARGREIDVAVGERIDERPDQLRARDRGAAVRTDVGGQTIEKHDLTVEEDDRHLGPRFVVHRRTARPSAAGGGARRREYVSGVPGRWWFAA